MGNSSEHELLREGEISSFGTELPQAEIEALVADRFGRKPYCLVEDWLIFMWTSLLNRSPGCAP